MAVRSHVVVMRQVPKEEVRDGRAATRTLVPIESLGHSRRDAFNEAAQEGHDKKMSFLRVISVHPRQGPKREKLHEKWHIRTMFHRVNPFIYGQRVARLIPGCIGRCTRRSNEIAHLAALHICRHAFLKELIVKARRHLAVHVDAQARAERKRTVDIG